MSMKSIGKRFGASECSRQEVKSRKSPRTGEAREATPWEEKESPAGFYNESSYYPQGLR